MAAPARTPHAGDLHKRWRVRLIRHDSEFGGDDDVTLNCVINPTQFDWNLSSDWVRHAIVGATGDGLQWARTKSRDYRLQFRHSLAAAQADAAGGPLPYELTMKGFEDFFLKLAYPITPGERPPDVTLVWPGYVVFRGIVVDLKMTHDRFSLFTGESKALVADVTFLDRMELGWQLPPPLRTA